MKPKSNKRPKKPRRTVVIPLSPQQKRRKQDGRPRGTYRIYLFEQTRLGFMLKYEVPVVYDLIMSLTPPKERRAPPVEIIRAVCAASPDPSLRKPKFQRWLEQYETSGVLCHRPKMPTPARMAFYHSIRSHKLALSVNAMNREKCATSVPESDFNSPAQ